MNAYLSLGALGILGLGAAAVLGPPSAVLNAGCCAPAAQANPFQAGAPLDAPATANSGPAACCFSAPGALGGELRLDGGDAAFGGGVSLPAEPARAGLAEAGDVGDE